MVCAGLPLCSAGESAASTPTSRSRCRRSLCIFNCAPCAGGASPAPTLRRNVAAAQKVHLLIPSGTASPCHRLAAARSRRGPDSPPGCHSIPRRRFAALVTKGRLWCGAKSSRPVFPGGIPFIHTAAPQWGPAWRLYWRGSSRRTRRLPGRSRRRGRYCRGWGGWGRRAANCRRSRAARRAGCR